MLYSLSNSAIMQKVCAITATVLYYCTMPSTVDKLIIVFIFFTLSRTSSWQLKLSAPSFASNQKLESPRFCPQWEGCISSSVRAALIVMGNSGLMYSLNVGDIESAQRRFSHAYKLRGETEDDRRDSLMDMAFLSIANNDYQSALATLQKAAEIFPSDPVIVNNAAVCHLYLGRLQEGLSYLEQRMTAEPALLLQETLVLNLATIYELESSYAGQKKRALLDLVSQYRGDSINTACLKLQ